MKDQKKDKDKSSPGAEEVRRYTKIAKDLPDVRQEKVEAIKKQVELGKYRISAEEVAGSIVDLQRSLEAHEKQCLRRDCRRAKPEK